MSADIVIVLGYILFIIGTLGLLLPLLPGAPLVFVGALLIAWSSEYEQLGSNGLMWIGILCLLTIATDLFASMVGAKRAGASGPAIWGAAIGGVLGLAFGPLGIIVGPFIGGFLGELYATRNLVKAGKVGFATWIGIVIGTIVKTGLGIAMVIILLS